MSAKNAIKKSVEVMASFLRNPRSYLNCIDNYHNSLKVAQDRQRFMEGNAQINKKNNNILFIWIPKSAGTSVFSLLEENGGQKLLLTDDIKRYFGQCGIVTFGHISIDSLLKEKLVTKRYLDSSWIFTVVRNPYDRTVSLFEYLKIANVLPPTLPFHLFCELIGGAHYEEIGLFNRKPLSQLNPQFRWLEKASGETLGSHIFYYENLGSLTEHLVAQGGLKSGQRLPRLNQSRSEGKPLSDYYNSKRAEIVYNAYREDFERFGYDENYEKLAPIGQPLQFMPRSFTGP